MGFIANQIPTEFPCIEIHFYGCALDDLGMLLYSSLICCQVQLLLLLVEHPTTEAPIVNPSTTATPFPQCSPVVHPTTEAPTVNLSSTAATPFPIAHTVVHTVTTTVTMTATPSSCSDQQQSSCSPSSNDSDDIVTICVPVVIVVGIIIVIVLVIVGGVVWWKTRRNSGGTQKFDKVVYSPSGITTLVENDLYGSVYIIDYRNLLFFVCCKIIFICKTCTKISYTKHFVED